MAKKKKAKSLRCPTCGTVVLPGDPEMPFCSERCRTIDLGKWASGAYRISSPVIDPDVLEGIEERHRSGHLQEEDDSAEKPE
jgi:endogenous inhibitor of DNA gyrase (YacG/DUF329 family)